jgi:hypothetical protein
MQFEVIIDNGHILNKDKVRTAFETLKDGTHLVEIEKLPLKHSKAQRNYFNSVIVRHYQLLFKDIKGLFHKSIVKGMIKKMFLTTEIVCEITGEVEEIVRDTRDLSISEYDLLIQECRLWYQHETGEILPEPIYYKGSK